MITPHPRVDITHLSFISSIYDIRVQKKNRVIIITRVSEVIMFSPCVFVCLFVSLSRCLSGRFDYEELVPQDFAGTLLGMSSCASYVSRTHDVIDDITRSQSRSNFEIDISPSIFELERRSKFKISEMVMAIFLVYSTSGITSSEKVCRDSKWWPFWKFLNIKHSFNLTLDMKRSSQLMP